MSKITPNLKLIKPQPLDNIKLSDLNDNLDKIDKIAAYCPIECGTSGIWTWEKYASGKFICECTYNINTDFTIAYGNVYKPSTGLNEIKLPPGFKEEPILDGKIKFGGIGGVQQSGSSNTKLKFWVWNAQKLTHNTQCVLSLKAEGYWK